MSAISPQSVTVLRLPAVAASVAEVVLTGLIARELGAGRLAQVLAAVSIAVSLMLLISGHLLETITLALPLWALLIWLIQRTIRTGENHLWLVIGAVAGIALMESDLVAGLLGAVIVGFMVVGPRRAFTTPWFYAGVVLAFAMWSPYLAWQASHGWPEFAVAHGIANGQSGTSTSRWLVMPFQLVLISIWLAPVWIAGLVNLIRGAYVGRAWGVTYAILAITIEVAGGKDYYLAGMFPLLLSAGAQPTVDWVRRRRVWFRGWMVMTAVGLSLAAVPVALPVVPVQDLHNTPIVALNSLVGDSVGWPAYAQEIAGVFHDLPSSIQRSAVILTSNYGEAGAVNHFGPASGLTAAVYSGHMSYWYWGPPPATAVTTIAVGFSRRQLTPYFKHVTLAAHLNNHLQVMNEEQGRPVWICTGLREPWGTVWPHLRNFG